jgi:hypothetical protein
MASLGFYAVSVAQLRSESLDLAVGALNVESLLGLEHLIPPTNIAGHGH